jgi:aminoglycoside phosphotransferase (APT) family kinase protein
VTADPQLDLLGLINRQALARFLGEALPPFSDVTVSLLAGGSSNLTYLVSVDGRDYVLRRRPLGPAAPRAHDMLREFTVLDAVRNTGLPVPHVYAYRDTDDVAGAPCYLMDFVDGHIIHGRQDAEGLTAESANACSARIVEVLAQLHAIDAASLNLPLSSPDGFLARRVDRWLLQWSASEHRALPQVEEVGEKLRSTLPPLRPATLIHGDYRLGNLIIDFTGEVTVKAILDWEMSTIGDPLTDLAHLLVYWEPTKGRITHRSQLVSEQPGFMTGAELAGLYGSASGRDLSDLSFYLAFEHWRAAIIKEAIYMRGLRGDTADHRHSAEIGRTVPLHLEEAAEILAANRAVVSPAPEGS